MLEQIDPAQKQVNFSVAQLEAASLCGHQTVLHGVRQLDHRLQIDNAGGAFDGMGSAHQSFQLFGSTLTPFQSEQAASKNGRLVLGFDAEKFQHRNVAEVIGFVHVRLRLRAEKSSSASSKPTALSFQSSIACVKAELDLATVAGGSFNWRASN